MITLNFDVDFAAFKQLTPKINIMFLGAIGDRMGIPPNMQDHVNLYGLDAINYGTRVDYIPIHRVVSAYGGPMTFIVRMNKTSSLLEINKQQVETYGQMEWYKELKRQEVDTATLIGVVEENKISHIDFLKTDIEGMDLSVVESYGNRISEASFVQMELRFEPMLQGERCFAEAINYMESKGFKVFDLEANDRWRNPNKNYHMPTRGRLNYVNALFVNEASNTNVRSFLAGLMGYLSYAEYTIRDAPQPVRDELEAFYFSAMDRSKRYFPSYAPHSVR